MNDTPARETSAVVETEKLSRIFELKGETIHALKEVDLIVKRGEFTAIAGPSGSGKSTLLNLIGALDTPTGGAIRVEGRELSGMNGTQLAEMRRDRIGFIFQSYNLIPVLTVLENVEYVMLLQGVENAERRARSLEVLEEVGLGGLERRKPSELSGGQQQRVAVARAIVSGPSIVLAAEPTANLDSTNGASLLDTMARMNKQRGVTFIFSTHDAMVMERARRLVRLHDGEIESDETRTA
jgi:putative ABC transport system ATP-binding protein